MVSPRFVCFSNTPRKRHKRRSFTRFFSGVLEDGEIASDPEPSPKPVSPSPGDFNDEDLIDQIVQKENEIAQKVKTPPSTSKRSNNRSERRATLRRQETSEPSFSSRNMETSWHSNGNGGERQMRPSPSEAVIFGINNGQQAINSDIARLQSLVHHSRDYYPSNIEHYPPIPLSQPCHFFNPPPPSLMSLDLHQQMMLPPPPPAPIIQPISPTPLPASFHDNYDEVSMEVVSPDEPQPSPNDPFIKPPIQIPLEAVVSLPSTSKAVIEDESSLREMLLSQLKQSKKRNAEKSSSQEKTPKRVRKNSSRLSNSVKNIFEAPVAISPQVPVAKIEKVPLEPTTSETVVPAETEAPPSEKSSELSRVDKRAQLDQLLAEISIKFEEERDKVQNANKQGREAVAMAQEAAELAKKAEEMNKKATEMRNACRDATKLGKDEMRRILIEKQKIQNEIDLMNIDDMEEMDDDAFPEIIISSIKLESTKFVKDEKVGIIESPTPKADPAENTPTQAVEPINIEKEVNESEVVVEKKETDVVVENKNDEIQNESVEGEDEYEEVEEPPSTPLNPTPDLILNDVVSDPIVNQAAAREAALDKEQSLRKRLLDKFGRTGNSPDVTSVVSSSIPDRPEQCRTLLLKMCKFELNGRCERPRDCKHLHLHDVTDAEQQAQLLEGLFREAFKYNESDIGSSTRRLFSVILPPVTRSYRNPRPFQSRLSNKHCTFYRNSENLKS
nr:protein F10G7.9 [imported] - Caenorhabditis elegans [Caenorhabditis elegans]